MPNKNKTKSLAGVIFPWWLIILFAASTFIIAKYILPQTQPKHPFLWSLFNILHNHSGIVLIIISVPGIKALYSSLRKKNILKRQKSFETLKALTWRQFEELVSEAYRQKGFRVVENQNPGPDDGIDVLIKKCGKTYIVQCKHWRNGVIGVKIVREMFGVMVAESADGVIIVTSGRFTKEARAFAFEKPITLLDGKGLLSLIQNIKNRDLAKTSFELKTNAPICELCGEEMILRMAKKGKNKGNEFWGCKNYPNCHFLVSKSQIY